MPMTVLEIVARLQAAQARFNDLLSSLSEAQMLRPSLPDGSSGKDLLAHLTFWDQRLLHAIEPAGGPDAVRIVPPIIADIPYNENWLTRVNGRIHELNRERSLSQVLADFRATSQRLVSTISRLSEHDIYDPDGLTALVGIPFAPMLLGSYGHLEEHTHELAAFHSA